MGFFSGFKKTINMAKYATELEIVLDAYTNRMPRDFSNEKIASELVKSTWEKNLSLFDNKLGGKPNKYTVIISALAESIYSNDLKKGDKHFLMSSLADLISQLEEKNFKGFTAEERDLILQARNSLIQFK